VIIAQISDIHAAADNDNLNRFYRALRWLDGIKPDALVITGDLIDNDWLAGYQSISAALKSRPFPSFVLPGNSDNKSMMRAVWANGSWSDTGLSESLHFVADIANLRLIGLDTTMDAAAEGYVGRHLTWLEERLLDKEDRPSILFLHHPIIPSGIPTMDSIMCLDGSRLAHFLQHSARRPIAIASGHVHRPIMGTFVGIPAYICGSICPANPLWLGTEHVPTVNDPPLMMIHHFIHRSLVSHTVAI